MKRESIVKLFALYCKEHWKLLLCYVLSFGILLFIFSLYDNEIEGVLYGFFLSNFFLFLVSGYDFFQYIKKHRALQQYQKEVRYSLEHLASDRSLIGQDYQALLYELQEEKNEQISNYEKERKELQDYFTLWAHQMKLPISAMKLLLETENQPDTKVLKSELFRVEQYVGMVLAYLRMNSISTDYVIQTYDLDSIIRQAIRRFSGEFIRKKIRLQFEETKKQVITDEKWLLFVIEQLLSNALKYTKEGTIQVYMKKEDVLVIEDTGIGIEKSDCYRVFEKGYTGVNGRYDKKASGLGLYLCKTIMDNLSHKIWIESEKGVGTKVMLSFEKRR